MAGFIQIIEYTTTRFDEVKALGEKFREERMATDGPRPLRITATASLDTPGKYVTIVEFASREEAMANSARPETHEFAMAMSALCEGGTFQNLEVVDVYAP